MSASEPSITISSLESHGVALAPFSHPDFARAFKEPRASAFDGILPYTVVIKNDTDREIIAYSVVWYCTGADGWVTQPKRTVFDFSSLRPGTNLPAHSKQIVSLVLAMEAGGRRADAQTEAAITELVAFFSKQTAVTISLEAVLFDDGNALGPDGAGWIPRWKAWLEAEREVFTKATQSSPSEARDVLRQLAEPGSQIARRQGDFQHFGHLAMLAERSNDYAECLDLMRGYFALAMLSELDEGRQPTLDNVRAILKSKRYPNVRRKEHIQ